MTDQRTLWWEDNAVFIIDQRLLPHEVRRTRLGTVDALIDAITTLAVRGAPALGAIGALGVALAMRTNDDLDDVRRDCERIAAARPTAVNLRWGVEQVLPHLDEGPAGVLERASAVVEADVEACRALSVRGADFLIKQLGERPLRILTHCNAGAFACVAIGTALGVVGELHWRGLVQEVIADETRPLLQGSRITAYELGRLGIPYRITLDGAGPSAIARNLVDAVVVGADRITANFDVCNKIGTMPLGLAADRWGIPFLAAAPESTIDLATASGDQIEIEERTAQEVHSIAGQRWTPEGADAWNPAFDVTPADLVTGIATQDRLIRPQLSTVDQNQSLTKL